MKIAENHQHLLDDLQTLVIEYRTKSRLISSDAPVIAINPFDTHALGLAMMGLIFFYPISCHRLAVVYDAKMYPRFKDSKLVFCEDEDEVATLNDYQLASASKTAFGLEKGDFKNFSEEAWQERKRVAQQPGVVALGSPDRKMLVFSQKQIFLERELSFGQVRHSFKRIPFACREAVPREWSQDWERKLHARREILPCIRRAQPEFASKLSNKELRRGCDMMIRAAVKYWNH